jgi:extradiol dioxygenase family protein
VCEQLLQVLNGHDFLSRARWVEHAMLVYRSPRIVRFDSGCTRTRSQFLVENVATSIEVGHDVNVGS